MKKVTFTLAVILSVLLSTQAIALVDVSNMTVDEINQKITECRSEIIEVNTKTALALVSEAGEAFKDGQFNDDEYVSLSTSIYEYAFSFIKEINGSASDILSGIDIYDDETQAALTFTLIQNEYNSLSEVLDCLIDLRDTRDAFRRSSDNLTDEKIASYYDLLQQFCDLKQIYELENDTDILCFEAAIDRINNDRK